MNKILCNLTILLIAFSIVKCQLLRRHSDYTSRNIRKQYTSPSDLFPDYFDRNNEATSRTNQQDDNYNENQIPLELLKRMNEVEDLSEFIEEFVDKDLMDPRDTVITSRFGDDEENVERSSLIVPKPATCSPQLAVVKLTPDTYNSSYVYFPSCTRIRQCGGCCTTDLLECQPTETVPLSLQVTKSKYTGSNKLTLVGKEILVVDEHTKCKCDCRIKAKDCKPFQKYDAAQCTCLCNNNEDKIKCLNDQSKIWDSTNCICRCRQVNDCTTGTYFDETQCKCLQMPTYIRNPNGQQIIDRKRFILKPLPVQQTDNTRYQTGS